MDWLNVSQATADGSLIVGKLDAEGHQDAVNRRLTGWQAVLIWSAAIHRRFGFDVGEKKPKAAMNRRTPNRPRLFWSAAFHRRFRFLSLSSKQEKEDKAAILAALQRPAYQTLNLS